MNFATFVISTGRCGTQWLATSLAAAFSDLIKVEHEPMHNRYEPRRALSRIGSSDMSSAVPATIVAHCEKIEKQLELTSFIECGHPCWSSIPYLVHRFRGRVRVIHLMRHPVPTCYSWLTHGAFQPPLFPHILEKILLTPSDPGVKFPEYQQIWDSLSPFEKCLYFWTEVNALALDLRTRLDVPWLQLKSEELFSQDGLDRTLHFLNLPPRESISAQKSEVVDQFHYACADLPDWRIIHDHPEAIAITRQFGYTLDEINEAALFQRYTMSAK